MPQELREGFTTGTAAAAAAIGAVLRLLGAEPPHDVSVALPPFADEGGPPRPATSRRLRIALEDGGRSADGYEAWASVVKDGGDDPDATHGMRILVRAAFTAPQDLSALSAPVAVAGVTLYGGPGVGVVTLPGLPVAVGEPAINPEPRRQIAFAALEAARGLGWSGPLHLCVSAPQGVERARRTLNGRLGIVGGVSILGTHGTVRPYSHEAWQATISQGLSVAAALGLPDVLCSTGRRSERLGFRLYPGLSERAGVQVGDYAAHAVREASRHPFSRLIWACFPGKLLKLAQGLEWTHADSAAADLALLGRHCAEEGGDAALARAVTAMPTAAGAFHLMMAEHGPVHDRVLQRLAVQAHALLNKWLADARRGSSTPPMTIVLHVFSLENEALLLSLET